jgi:hypothetical protein
VTFDIEPLGQQVKLTVMHDGFEPGSAVRESISGGWPVVLANLKTLLETGDTLPGPDTSTPDRMAGSAVRE